MMRYFTPDLLIRGNSTDDAVIDAAEDGWEAATTAYEERLAEIGPTLPAAVRRLSDLCLHDGRLLAWEQQPAEPAGSNVVLASVQLGGELTSIVYGLAGDVRQSTPRTEFPFSPRQVEWLYDEVDRVDGGPEGTYLHRILFSDGREVDVPFTWVLIHRVPLPTAAAPALTRQPA